MAGTFQFGHAVDFRSASSAEILHGLPSAAGVLCLRGVREEDRPYLTRTADLRRRAMRLLAPPELTEDGQAVLSKRLNLRDRVARIEWSVVGSEFEGLLLLYQASCAAFGVAEARRRLRLHAPFFLRLTIQHAHPRLYATNRLARRALREMIGPFASRAAAERYADAVLDLFKLRRCHEDLQPYPEHPGCVYGEMKKCLAPCNLGCSPDQYAGEAEAVRAFLETCGGSMLEGMERERERASEEMDFERAASLHAQWTRVKGAAALAGELARPLPHLRAVIVQAAPGRGDGDALEAAVFLLEGGRLAGPERLSTLGVRAVREQTSVGSSLFAQPLMLQAIPLEGTVEAAAAALAAHSPEDRADRVLASLSEAASSAARADDPGGMEDDLSLVRRWFYRPEKARTGEIFFPNQDGSWPVRRILRWAARLALGDPGKMAETQRDAVAGAKVKILHEGREGVAREVAVVPRSPGRRRKTGGHAAELAAPSS